MVRTITCSSCRRKVAGNPRVKDQRYCNRPACQRERKRRWQKAKMETDPDYRENQREAQKNWREQNPDYWRNRKAMKKCRSSPAVQAVVKMDTLSRIINEKTGEYMIYPTDCKMDALRVKIIALSG